MQCPHCKAAVFKLTADGTRMKARTSILVLHKSGEVEMNCGSCGHAVLVPLKHSDGPFELRKAVEVKLVLRRP